MRGTVFSNVVRSTECMVYIPFAVVLQGKCIIVIDRLST